MIRRGIGRMGRRLINDGMSGAPFKAQRRSSTPLALGSGSRPFGELGPGPRLPNPPSRPMGSGPRRAIGTGGGPFGELGPGPQLPNPPGRNRGRDLLFGKTRAGKVARGVGVGMVGGGLATNVAIGPRHNNSGRTGLRPKSSGGAGVWQ